MTRSTRPPMPLFVADIADVAGGVRVEVRPSSDREYFMHRGRSAQDLYALSARGGSLAHAVLELLDAVVPADREPVMDAVLFAVQIRGDR